MISIIIFTAAMQSILIHSCHAESDFDPQDPINNYHDDCFAFRNLSYLGESLLDIL